MSDRVLRFHLQNRKSRRSRRKECNEDDVFNDYHNTLMFFTEASRTHRCALSRAMMHKPVQHQGIFYELNTFLKMRHSILTHEENSWTPPIDGTKLQQIQAFSREAIPKLIKCFQYTDYNEEVLDLIGECLTTLNPTKDFDYFALVFDNINETYLYKIFRQFIQFRNS